MLVKVFQLERWALVFSLVISSFDLQKLLNCRGCNATNQYEIC